MFLKKKEAQLLRSSPMTEEFLVKIMQSNIPNITYDKVLLYFLSHNKM